MALKLYNPKTKAFSTYTPSDGADLPLIESLLLNILIEMHVHSHYLAAITQATEPVRQGVVTDEPSNIRTDVVSVT